MPFAGCGASVAFAQTNGQYPYSPPWATPVVNVGPGSNANPNAGVQTLLTGAISAGPITPTASGGETVAIPSPNGATITLTATAPNGNVQTVGTYTAQQAVNLCVGSGTTITATASGGTPSGNTTLSYDPAISCGSTGGLQQVQEVGAGYLASGKTSTPSTIAAAGATSTFTPLAHRNMHWLLSGTGVATCAAEEQIDGTNWYPFTVNGSPFYVLNYSGSPMNETIQEDVYGIPQRLNCGATNVSGSANGSYTSGSISVKGVQ